MRSTSMTNHFRQSSSTLRNLFLSTTKETEITDVASLIELIRGSTVIDGGHCQDGVHFELSSGHKIMFIGLFVIGVLREEEQVH